MPRVRLPDDAYEGGDGGDAPVGDLWLRVLRPSNERRQNPAGGRPW